MLRVKEHKFTTEVFGAVCFEWLLDVENSEGCLDEMRDVRGVDELFEGLFSAKV